jgi:hypothetical protein
MCWTTCNTASGSFLVRQLDAESQEVRFPQCGPQELLDAEVEILSLLTVQHASQCTPGTAACSAPADGRPDSGLEWILVPADVDPGVTSGDGGFDAIGDCGARAPESLRSGDFSAGLKVFGLATAIMVGRISQPE